MKYVLSVIAVLSAPMIYGVICVPTISQLTAANPGLLNEMGGTEDVGLILQIEAIQAIVMLIIGVIVAAIARFKEMLHVGIATAVMLAIGVSVQVSFWEAMPAWHHFVFFALIVITVPAGGMIQQKLFAGAVEAS